MIDCRFDPRPEMSTPMLRFNLPSRASRRYEAARTLHARLALDDAADAVHAGFACGLQHQRHTVRSPAAQPTIMPMPMLKVRYMSSSGTPPAR